ncbi:TolC family protein [Zhouia sp. PK063]|uniref:TolC family protein n=1 Tax=Zhouia sp. PK063 TaxID=3373602 RepID=UPI0037B07222
MNYKTLSILIIILSASFNKSSYAQVSLDSSKISLEEAFYKADIYSKTLKEQHLKTRIGEENVLNAKKQILPNIDIDASYGKLSNIPVYVDGILNDAKYIPIEDHSIYDASVSTYFNIYNGHKTKNNIKIAEAKKELLNSLEQETLSQIHFQVATNYLNLQRYVKFKQLIKQNIKQNKERLNLIEKLFTNGVVLKSDLLRAQLQLSKQETQLVTMNNNIVLAQQSLNIIIGNNDNTQILPSDSISISNVEMNNSYNDYVKQTLQSSPLEKIAEKQVKISELQLKTTKSNKLPKIGLFGSYTYSYPQILLYPYAQSPYLLGEVGIKLSYSLSALYHDKHQEIAAELYQKQQNIAKLKVQDKLREGIKTAFNRYNEDLDKIKVSKQNITQAKENYRIVNQTYFNQLALITDLLDADTQLLEAKFDLVNNQIAAKLHHYQLLKITGEL